MARNASSPAETFGLSSPNRLTLPSPHSPMGGGLAKPSSFPTCREFGAEDVRSRTSTVSVAWDALLRSRCMTADLLCTCPSDSEVHLSFSYTYVALMPRHRRRPRTVNHPGCVRPALGLSATRFTASGRSKDLICSLPLGGTLDVKKLSLGREPCPGPGLQEADDFSPSDMPYDAT